MSSVLRKASTRCFSRTKESLSSNSFSMNTSLAARAIVVEQAQMTLGTASASYMFHSSSRTEAVRPALLKKERLRQQEKQAAELREVRARMEAITKPDPILGHQLNDAGRNLWESSELCRVVLTKDEVWGVREDRRGNLISTDDLTDLETSTKVEQVDQTASLGPKRLNFGLDNEEDRALLFGDLPAVIVEDKIRVSSTHVSLTSEDISTLSRSLEADEEVEREHSDQLSRILDLRNANGRAIRVENIRRIIEHFGAKRKEDGTIYYDSGSPETQAAVLTYRIRNLHEHSLQARHDNSNRRGMTMLVHQRAKILRYLKKKSEDRYQALLPRLGLERRAVEGEIIVPGKPRMAMGM